MFNKNIVLKITINNHKTIHLSYYYINDSSIQRIVIKQAGY